MSEIPFGERFFATRGRLAKVASDIVAFAAENGVSPDEPLSDREAGNSLEAPLLFVVCGEVNSGKSTLLNALSGCELCEVSQLPETQRVLWYRHGATARDTLVNPLLEERHRPVEFLRNFNLLDTPGTNSTVQGHTEISASFLPGADLIFVVFSASNPWAAATWNLVSGFSGESLDRVVFVIQQADQKDAADIQVILGHMADLSMKRIGRVPPVFAVSGRLACEAKRTRPVAAGPLKASGFQALEDFIDRSICQSSQRRGILEGWRSKTANVLHAVEDRIEEQSSGINQRNHFVQSVEHEIDTIRESFVSRLPKHLASVAEVFQTEAVWVTKRLRRKMGALASFVRLFSRDRVGQQMEAVFIERLREAVVAVAEKDGSAVAAACQDHWRDLGPRVLAETGIDLDGGTPITETLTTTKERFVHRLEHAAQQGVGNLNVRNQLVKDLRRRNTALRSFILTALCFITAGASCGALGVPWLPWILLGVAGLFLAAGVWVAWLTRKMIAREFQQRLLDTCGAFATTLRSDYEEALRNALREYGSRLGEVRSRLADEKLSIEPRMKRWQELFLTLKAIEQEL